LTAENGIGIFWANLRALGWENDVIYRERYEVEYFEERYRNIVLRQQSVFGPWFVMALGVVLALFVIYLIYSNILLPPSTLSSLERSLRVIALPAGVPPSALHHVEEETVQQVGPAVTAVPHSRAANALLGGHGPAAAPRLATTAQRATAEHVTDGESGSR
jgi:hypothetical protein